MHPSSVFGELRWGHGLVASFIKDMIDDIFLTHGVGPSLNFALGVLGSLFAPPCVAASSVGNYASSLLRVSSAVSYLTPNFRGLAAQIQFAPSEQVSNIGGFFHGGWLQGQPVCACRVLQCVGNQAQGLLTLVAVQRPTEAHAHRVGRVVVGAEGRTAHHAHPVGA